MDLEVLSLEIGKSAKVSKATNLSQIKLDIYIREVDLTLLCIDYSSIYTRAIGIRRTFIIEIRLEKSDGSSILGYATLSHHYL